jgi:tRNA 2-thiouridine synthesizing protein A
MVSVTEHQLDVRRLLCPLPVIRVQDKVKALADGAVLAVHCTDPGAVHDIPAWCRVHGHRIIAIEQTAQEITIKLQVVKQ